MNLISIYGVFCMYFCNLNARFTSIFLKITSIPHLLMFCRTRRKIKQSDEEPRVLQPWQRCSELQRRPLTKAKKEHLAHMTLGFAKAKQSFAKEKGEYAERRHMASPQQRSFHRSEEHRVGAANFAFLAHHWPIFHCL